MSKKHQTHDPYAQREAKKYSNPIPSREYIVQLLTAHGQLMTKLELEQQLELTSEADCEALGFRLSAMVRDGQLIRTRNSGYGLPKKMSLIRGIVLGHPDGFGFVKSEDSAEKYFLSAGQMRQVIHGDHVLVRPTLYKVRGLTECRIVEILQRNTEEIVGRFHDQNDAYFVIPESKFIQHQIIIPAASCFGATNGDIVMVQLLVQPDKHQAPIGKVTEVIGQHMAPGMEIDIAIRVYGIPNTWPHEIEAELENIPSRVLPSEIAERTDLRDLPFITIDGADAKDFDDAVYCETTEMGWVLYVAIADVAHYVKPNSALDLQASVRGNSVYFPERVVPMLPFKLSAGICSLKPEVNRLALVCKMTLTNTGKIRHYEFLEATIHSKARLTYEKVAKILIEHDSHLQKQYADIVPLLNNLYALFQILHQQRKARGALELEIPETKIIFSDDKKISAIECCHRNDAHRLIEECMLMANVCAAKFLIKHKIPTLYRIHAKPTLDSLANFRAFLNTLGLTLGGGDDPEPLDYARLLKKVAQRDDKTMIQTLLLRSLSQAVYQADNIGHFGLAYKAYTHYTSPIRRYPDLLVHRAIKHLIQGLEVTEFDYTRSDIDKLGMQCSMTERRADQATRDVIEWLKCEYMQDKLGTMFPAHVATVTAFGIFVALQDIYVEGLVHVTSLPNDYYQFDAIKHQLIGERTGLVYKIGDPLMVRLVRVDLDERKIDFDLGEMTERRPPKKRRRKPRD